MGKRDADKWVPFMALEMATEYASERFRKLEADVYRLLNEKADLLVAMKEAVENLDTHEDGAMFARKGLRHAIAKAEGGK